LQTILVRWIVMAAWIARVCCRKGSIAACTDREKLRIDPIQPNPMVWL
jgi:hypothetical protein